MKESKTKCETCSLCDEVYPEDKLTKLDGKHLCLECLSRETRVCSHCGEWIQSVDNRTKTTFETDILDGFSFASCIWLTTVPRGETKSKKKLSYQEEIYV